ncbi:hypothetical protein VLK31_24850 [Variovorax sp. H27-G14]|uniref:hypothetical protein n=1 Tax=Variovorax sp. H27-G14 TaxID=3111914 RepID=UPI0038FBE776
MKKSQFPVYATSEDWTLLVATVSQQRPLKLVKAGLFENPLPQICSDMNELVPLTIYLVLDEAIKVSTRQVTQRDETVKHAIDQLENPDSVSLHLGGLASENRLLAGQIGTVRPEKASQDLYALFTREIMNTFAKIKSYYVGPGAQKLLVAGVRLSPTLKSPPTYDLPR